MEQYHKLTLGTEELLVDPESYPKLVGRLIYLVVTRPDLAYSFHILSQFMQAPCIEHWDTAFRVVRYLKDILSQGILLRAKCDLTLQVGVTSIGLLGHLLGTLLLVGLYVLDNLQSLGK